MPYMSGSYGSKHKTDNGQAGKLNPATRKADAKSGLKGTARPRTGFKSGKGA